MRSSRDSRTRSIGSVTTDAACERVSARDQARGKGREDVLSARTIVAEGVRRRFHPWKSTTPSMLAILGRRRQRIAGQ